MQLCFFEIQLKFPKLEKQQNCKYCPQNLASSSSHDLTTIIHKLITSDKDCICMDWCMCMFVFAYDQSYV